MFGRKPPAANFTPPQQPTEPEPTAPKVELGEDLKALRRDNGPASKITDIDFSDSNHPKILFENTWHELSIYRTKAKVTLSDLTFRGGWSQLLSDRRGDNVNWYERLIGRAHLTTEYGEPILSFIDWGESKRPTTKAQYTILQASFRDTSVIADTEYDAHRRLMNENRSSDDYYHGSPIKLFRTGEEAHTFLRSEILCYGEDFSFLYKDEIEAKQGRPQQYRYPELVLSNAGYRSYSDSKHQGFYGSDILIPPDVYSGLRRSIADFREGLVITAKVWIELYGMDVKVYPNLPEPASAALSIIPSTAQLTCKIDDFTVEWDDAVRPFSRAHRGWDET
jgi:hypothetical protein